MGAYQCDQCLKWFSSPYNVLCEASCAYSNTNSGSHSSTTEDELHDMYTEMQGQSVKSYTDEETGEETEEHHTLMDEESSENYEESEEEGSNPWFLGIYIKRSLPNVTLRSIKQCRRTGLPMKKPRNMFIMP